MNPVSILRTKTAQIFIKSSLEICLPFASAKEDRVRKVPTFFLFKILTGVQLLCSAVLVSAVQQSESALCIHTSALFWISFPLRSPQSSGVQFPELYSGFSLVTNFIHSTNSVSMSIPILPSSLIKIWRQDQWEEGKMNEQISSHFYSPGNQRRHCTWVFMSVWFSLMLDIIQFAGEGWEICILFLS